MATTVPKPATAPNEDELLTAKQVAELGLLPYHPRTILDLAREGKIGRIVLSPLKVRFTRQHIADFKAAGERPQRVRTATKAAR